MLASAAARRTRSGAHTVNGAEKTKEGGEDFLPAVLLEECAPRPFQGEMTLKLEERESSTADSRSIEHSFRHASPTKHCRNRPSSDRSAALVSHDDRSPGRRHPPHRHRLPPRGPEHPGLQVPSRHFAWCECKSCRSPRTWDDGQPASPSPLDAIRQKGEVHARTKCYHSFDSFPHTPEILPVTSGATFPLGNKFMWDLGLGRWNNDLRPACDAFFGPGGYDAAVDQCWAYPELRRAYPDAKVILTVRDPEEWYRSYMTNLVAFDACAMIADLDAGGHLGNGVSPFHPGAMGVMRILGSDYRKERAIQIFNEWNEAIKAEVPSEKLLVLDVRQGWEPLCRFLIRIGSLMFGWNDSE